MLQTIVRPTVDALELGTQPTRPREPSASRSAQRFEEALQRATVATERDPAAQAEDSSAVRTEERDGTQASPKDGTRDTSPNDTVHKDEAPAGKDTDKDADAGTGDTKQGVERKGEADDGPLAKGVAKDKDGNDKSDATHPVSPEVVAGSVAGIRQGKETAPDADAANASAGASEAAGKAVGPTEPRASREADSEKPAEGEEDAADEPSARTGAPARHEAADPHSSAHAAEPQAARRRAAAAEGDDAADDAAGARAAQTTQATASGEAREPAAPTAEAARARAAARGAQAVAREADAAGESDAEGEAGTPQRRVVVVDARGGSTGDGGGEAGSRRESAEQGSAPRQQVAADPVPGKGETETIRLANQLDVPQQLERPTQSAPPSSFRDVHSGFLRQMREQGNAEIVRQSTVVLRNADSGEIRLVLKPESLGEVRIRVQLQDNHIAGRIVVENNSVREMFQDNLDALTRAFRESGYETGSLDVEVRDRGGNGRRRQAGTSPSGRLVRELEDSVPTVASLGSPEALVDVFV